MVAVPIDEAPNHPQPLRELHDELEKNGLLAPSSFWARKLALWLPTFLLSYFAMMVVPLWALGPAGFRGVSDPDMQFVFGWATAVPAFLTMSCISSLMTASVFIPNHIGMRRLERGQKLSYLEQQVTTSRNIDNPRALDFYRGGLTSQIRALASVGNHLGSMTAAFRASTKRARAHRLTSMPGSISPW